MKRSRIDGRVEQAFLARAQLMFRIYPELLSFCLQEEEEEDATAPESDDVEEKFDLYVGLVQAVSDDFQQEMCDAVTAFLTEVVHENPDTIELLRGRTFARTIH